MPLENRPKLTDFGENAKKAETEAASPKTENTETPFVLPIKSGEGKANPFIGEKVGNWAKRMPGETSKKIESVITQTVERGGAFAERVKGTWEAAKEAWNKNNETGPSEAIDKKPALETIAENNSNSNDSVLEAENVVALIGHTPTSERKASGRSSINKALEMTTRAGVENQGLISRIMKGIANILLGKFRKAAIEANKKKLSDPNPVVAERAQRLDNTVTEKITIVDQVRALEERMSALENPTVDGKVDGIDADNVIKFPGTKIEEPVGKIESESKNNDIENGYDDNIYAFNAAFDEEPIAETAAQTEEGLPKAA
jgi:hypothetical protein